MRAESVDSPHVLAENLTKLARWNLWRNVASQVLLIRLFDSRLRHISVARYRFFSCKSSYLSYWVSSLSLTVGYYDLNLWDPFALIVLYKNEENGSWNHAGSRIGSGLHQS